MYTRRGPGGNDRANTHIDDERQRMIHFITWGVECVQNLDEFHTRMVERNVACIQEPTETFGARIAQHVDPDGLAISVSEERRGP